jgi:hypothetical protein
MCKQICLDLQRGSQSQRMTQVYLRVGVTRKALKSDASKYIQVYNFVSIFSVELIKIL